MKVLDSIYQQTEKTPSAEKAAVKDRVVDTVWEGDSERPASVGCKARG